MRLSRQFIMLCCALLLLGAGVPVSGEKCGADGKGHEKALRAMPFGVEGDSIVIRQGSSLFLEPNVPNPFKSETEISYTLDRETKVVLRVYDAFYNDVITLVEEDTQAPGRYVIPFTPAGRFGSGMYFYSLTTSAGTETRRMMFVE